MNRFAKYPIIFGLFYLALCPEIKGEQGINVLSDNPPDDILQNEITLPGQNNTIFQILNQVSRQTGFFFIYDSQIINNDEKVRIRRDTYTIEDLLGVMLDDPLLEYKVIDKYIIIRKPSEPLADEISGVESGSEADEKISIFGKVMDAGSGKTLPYATIALLNKASGVTTNRDGVFNLRLPATMADDTLRISYVGYKARIIPVALLLEGTHDIYLQPDLISLQEVIITYYDPYEILRNALEARAKLYAARPAHHTSFYREGVLKGEKVINYSEAVFRIHKTAYNQQIEDQVVLLKSRNITNLELDDTLMLKLKAGVRSALELDVMKTLPEFLQEEYLKDFDLKGSDIVAFDGGAVFAIEFTEAGYVSVPQYTGTILIDRETFAILQVDFEIHPTYLRKNERRFIPKRSPDHFTRIQSMRYVVQYRNRGGTYHLYHVRGDVDLRVRQKNRLFGQNYNVFFEMAVVDIDTLRTDRFRRRDLLNTRNIFSDQDFEYDHEFWKEFITIYPEKRISDALREMNTEIESLIQE
ncbi:MAG: carboxypeptidase-like regulatory domain-containing protein [Bacteroidales bacterium]